MWWKVVLLLGAAACLYQVLAKVPPKEDMCGMIVDIKVESQCLECFTKAGDISEHPERVRGCAATYLPPDLANCSVPHARKLDSVRIGQGGGNYHNNHTNANFLPTCLTRRLRRLKSYQKREKRFVKQASEGIQTIVDSKLVPHGAATILSIQAMTDIIQIPSIKKIVEKPLSNCQDEYISERLLQPWETDMLAETDEYDLADLVEEMIRDSIDEIEDDNGSSDDFEDESVKKSLRAASGGTNSLKRRVMLYKCVTSAVFKSGAGPQVLETIMQEDFFHPVPQWWVKQLLKIAIKASENNK